MIAQHYLDDVLVQLRKYRTLGEKALAQVDDDAFFHAAHEDENSIALVIKHMTGNMRSRWTDFLTTDGEKPDRRRDYEFILESQDSRDHLMRRWNEGWDLTLSTIGSLRPDDLLRTVTIRGEEHTVLEAINRQLTHYAYHVGLEHEKDPKDPLPGLAESVGYAKGVLAAPQ
jgi:hypothetical protein